MFDKAKELYRLKKQADAMKKQMEAITHDVNEKGVNVVIRGDNYIESLEVDGEQLERVKNAVNKAHKEVQKKVAKKMQSQMGDLGLPGF